MDIVSKDLSFDAYLIVNPDENYAKQVDLGPWCNISASLSTNDIIATIEENDAIDLYFHSTDPNAKLFFTALECCPMTSRIQSDNGLVYCTPGSEAVKIYRSDPKEYDALRVDNLQILVKCYSDTYISFINVIPKQLSTQEWEIMRDDLEREIRGLAQDIVRRNIGVGQQAGGVIPPKDLYAFLVFNKRANAIVSALLDIKDRPKYKQKKYYQLADESEYKEIDAETVKYYLQKGAADNKLLVPHRKVIYDIPENRILKHIIKFFDKKLSQFSTIVAETIRYHKQCSQKNQLYERKYIEGLTVYLNTVNRLKMITNIIKSAEWYQEITEICEVFVPHSFALDPRYGTLYRVYTEMNSEDFSVQLNPQYSYSWKKSSLLYEMWCYICVCRYLLQEYSLVSSQFDDIFTKNQLFPFLESGTKINLENDDLLLEIVYDVCLPDNSSEINLHDRPLFMTEKHCRPDICIDLYSKKSNWYIGSIIIECKYRKLTSFWSGSTWSSKEQIRAYHNGSKSKFYCGGTLEAIASPRPVSQVLVFSPDDSGKGSREYRDDNVYIKVFKPTPDRSYIKEACDDLFQAIQKQLELANHTFEQSH